MTVKVNGRPRELPDGATVAELLDQLGLRPDGVAVAIGRDVVPRSRHAERALQEGEEIEVIRAVGGG